MALASLSRPNDAHAEGLVPRVLVGGRLHDDRVRVVLVGGEELGRDDRTTTALELGLGLAIAAPSAWLPEGELTVAPRLALELGLVRGDGRLGLGVDGTWAFLHAGPLALSAGLGLGLHLGLARPAASAVELTLILAARLGPVELAWRPALLLPLASNDDPVFGGTQTQAVAPGLAPAALMLAIDLDPT